MSPNRLWLWVADGIWKTVTACSKLRWWAYDNMCNLAKLKAIGQFVAWCWKVIDVFHFQNHMYPDCKFKTEERESWLLYTQAGEQTFVWVHRFSHILCSMNKVHHLFLSTPCRWYYDEMSIPASATWEEKRQFSRKELYIKKRNYT